MRTFTVFAASHDALGAAGHAERARARRTLVSRAASVKGFSRMS